MRGSLKSIQPIQFQPIWAKYETWGWEQQSKWALANTRSDCLRREYIQEQLEFAKEKREAQALAAALNPMLREIVKDALLEVLR